MAKTALEVIVEQHTKDIDRIGDGMEQMVAGINGLREDMAERGDRYIKIQTDHALEDSQRFGRLEAKIALYIGIGMCFAAFAKDIIAGIAVAAN